MVMLQGTLSDNTTIHCVGCEHYYYDCVSVCIIQWRHRSELVGMVSENSARNRMYIVDHTVQTTEKLPPGGWLSISE